MLLLALLHQNIHPALPSMNIDTVLPWIEAGGYIMLFALLFACGLGLPMPEDIPLIISGILISQHHMRWEIAGPAAWMGIIGGDCMLYMFGRRYGRDVVKVPFVGKHVTLARIDKAERYFHKYGVWVVAIGRMFAGIRGAMVVAAGASRFKFLRFIIADGLAAIVSGGMFMFIGFWFGSNRAAMEHKWHRFKLMLTLAAIVLAIVLTVYFIWRSRRQKSRHLAESHAPDSPSTTPIL